VKSLAPVAERVQNERRAGKPLRLIDRGWWDVSRGGPETRILALIYMDDDQLTRLVRHASTNKTRKACAGPLMVIIP
jgi:hypothetical protein